MTEMLADTLPASEPSYDADAPAMRATIDRYVVLDRLGAGGMGVVLSAYDPVLDRRVAIKLLRPSERPGGAEERRTLLQREAQAMARLSHPNVVAVHDVGVIGDQLYIAMEFIDGQTLRDWLTGAVHDWREVARLFSAVGSGLFAAHAAKLVHRDFKPDNVLIGRDGRPRVVDFGLVGGVGELADSRRGSMMGTPGYMSPEQLRGDRSDARSDQYSFCVALYEALDSAPPFRRDEYRDAVLSGRVPPPPRRAPRWLGDIVLRGLQLRPEDRWPDMAALIAALARDPARSRRRALVAAAAVIAVGLVVAGLFAAQRGPRERIASCDSDGLGYAWDISSRVAVGRAFANTGLAYAGDTFERVSTTLDRYAAAWTTMHAEACRAPNEIGDQAASVRDLRLACLDARRSTLAALTGEWSQHIDAKGLENAISTAASLPSLDLCADTRALVGRMPLPRDPAARARIAATRAALDRARALRAAGHMEAARTAAEAAQKLAAADDYAAVSAEAALVYGGLLHDFQEPGAVPPLEDAVRLAAKAGDDRLAADAAIELIGAMVDSGQAPLAIATAKLAEALVVRAGDRPAQRGALRLWQGDALAVVGAHVAEATEVLSEARALLTQSLGPTDPLTLEAGERLYRVLQIGDRQHRDALGKELLAAELDVLGPDHPQTGTLEGRLGIAAREAGDYVTARRFIDRSIAVAERAYGPVSLPTALAVNRLGTLEGAEDHLDAQAVAYERVLAIRRQLLAPTDPLVAHALANLSIPRRLQHRYAEAFDENTTALDIMRRAYGDANSDVAYETGLLADLFEMQGRLREARDSYQRSVALWKRVNEPAQTNLGFTMLALANVDVRLGRYADARELIGPGTEMLAKAFGRDHLALAMATKVRARCDLDEHGSADVTSLETAMHILEKQGAPPADVGSLRFELGRAAWSAGDRARGFAEAKTSKAELEQAGTFAKDDLARVDSWLTKHAP
ncbi:MAG TPA: serine/threonine-protein kinase [Kofleriaceae bacterium]|jgi:tetratricopeptide (TPR) repeat protein